jgi:hypothetical protein
MRAQVALFLVAFASGCAAVAKLDVSYHDAGNSGDASAPSEAGSTDGTSNDGAPTLPVVTVDASTEAVDATGLGKDATPGPDGSCPCDTSASLGCCVPAGGDQPYCTEDGASCTRAGGAFATCAGYDSNTDSVCCWSGGAGGGGATSYAGSCGTRVTACSGDDDCAGRSTSTCATTSCKGVTLGACAPTAPVCP